MVARDTRDRILEVARELFTAQGYEATSLREIADRLGITKAALYYHFRSKDEIFAALLAPVASILDEMVRRLEAADGASGWADSLEWVIDQFFANRDFFLLLEHNRPAVAAMTTTFGDAQEVSERIERAVRDKGDLALQIRMIAALGAVTAFDDWAPRLLAQADAETLRRELAAATRDLLGLPRHPTKRAGATTG